MKVWELLSDESKWTKSAFARNNAGSPCSAVSDEACSWCAIGAINKCYSDQKENRQVSKKVYAKIEIDSLSMWNDDHTYQDVYNLFKELDI